MLRFIFIFGLLISLATPAIAENNPAKLYTKDYYQNGVLKAEGWEMGTMKTGYWKFYYEDGTLRSKGHYKNDKANGYWYYFSPEGVVEKEGHYIAGKAENWWIFYDLANASKTKFQFKNNKKNGYALCYKNNKLKRAEQYQNNKIVGTWTSIYAFRRDNPNATF